MMVTFISQCEKKALKKTRRVLDAFANRIGDNTWQTLITEDGLNTVRKMLSKTASRSTAVSCHWVRSRTHSQLVWIVGNRRKFNLEGNVPVNRTELDLSHKEWEQGWQLNEVIVLATAMAGLFHDFGKANALFQQKLRGQTAHQGEPYRHEWVSLRLFEAFAKGKADQQWLDELSELTPETAVEHEAALLARLFTETDGYQPVFDDLSPFARIVAWLIVSHHRLPVNYDADKAPVELSQIDQWLSRCFGSHWNAPNALNLGKYDPQALADNWRFPDGTPFLSQPWQQKARQLAQRARQYPWHSHGQVNWLSQRFVSHMARLSLMLADHYYSSLPLEKSKPKWRDRHYAPIANTDQSQGKRKNAPPKQQLDEHNIGVAINARRFAENLPSLKWTMPAIAQHRRFSQGAEQEKYRWQDIAYRKTKTIATQSERQGFFGINMASTGCGKTIANARIMYALSDPWQGCRFSVALGLRTLTLQTGDAYRDLLKLGDDELGVLVGSQATQRLHEAKNTSHQPSGGSESTEDFLEQLFISYEGQIYDGRLKHWLSSQPKLEKLVSAPVLVSTIDHLMPATESLRGGYQIAPMLRLLSTDLVLDEPDDFGLEDLPALCRLVNWAGMLGSRVLLSSATLPPSLVKSLFDAYRAGRAQFNHAQFGDNASTHEADDAPVICGWLDEFTSEIHSVTSKTDYVTCHREFVAKRVKRLEGAQQVLRKGKTVDTSAITSLAVPSKSSEPHLGLGPLAQLIHTHIHQLHHAHHQSHASGKTVSVGVVRMANINPMVALTRALVQISPEPDHALFICPYHSQFPLALRSYRESRLDAALNRHDEAAIFEQPEIRDAISNSDAKHLIFVVAGTAVVEVGRDHDYDWAIAEPSSMRALIQLAGRVQRHRQQAPTSANIHVLDQNVRGLKGKHPAYCKPGFESDAIPLEKGYRVTFDEGLTAISATPRIQEVPKLEKSAFIFASSAKKAAKPVSHWGVQEHRALRFTLELTGGGKYHSDFFRTGKEAELWWNETLVSQAAGLRYPGKYASWSGELIRRTPFRHSQPQESFVLAYNDDDTLAWQQLDTSRYPYQYADHSYRFKPVEISLAAGCHWWFDVNPEAIYQHFADQLGWSVKKASQHLGEIRLAAEREGQNITWCWHPQLGAYRE